MDIFRSVVYIEEDTGDMSRHRPAHSFPGMNVGVAQIIIRGRIIDGPRTQLTNYLRH